MKLISVIIMAISAFELYRSWKLALKGRLSPLFAVLWGVVWIAVALFILFPALTDTLMSFAGMTSRIAFIFMVGLLILYVITYQMFIESKRNTISIARLTQRLALMEYQFRAREKEKAE